MAPSDALVGPAALKGSRRGPAAGPDARVCPLARWVAWLAMPIHAWSCGTSSTRRRRGPLRLLQCRGRPDALEDVTQRCGRSFHRWTAILVLPRGWVVECKVAARESRRDASRADVGLHGPLRGRPKATSSSSDRGEGKVKDERVYSRRGRRWRGCNRLGHVGRLEGYDAVSCVDRVLTHVLWLATADPPASTAGVRR